MEKILRFGNKFGDYDVPLSPILDSSELVLGKFDHFFLHSGSEDSIPLDGIKLVYPTEIIDSNNHLDIAYNGVLFTNLDTVNSTDDLLIATRSFYAPLSNSNLSDFLELSKSEDFLRNKIFITDYEISTKIKGLFEDGELSQSKTISPAKLRDALLYRNL